MIISEDDGTFHISEEGPHAVFVGEDGEHKVIRARVSAGSDGEAVWVGEDAEAHVDGQENVIVIRKVKEPKVVKSAEERKESFLAEHPEADTDGDGVISDEEAKAFAAKVQQTRKKVEKKPN